MKALEVQCGHCHRRLAAKPHMAGKRVRCPNCSSLIQLPELNVDDTIESVCNHCETKFKTSEANVGKEVTCPSCGLSTQVSAGKPELSQSETLLSTGDLLSSGDPLLSSAPRPQASPFGPAPKRSDAGKTLQGHVFLSTRSGIQVHHLVGASVALIAAMSFLLCLASGHPVVGTCSLLAGLAVAFSSFIFPPLNRSFGTDKNEVIAASVIGGALVVVSLLVAFVAKSAMGDTQPLNHTVPVLAALLGMLIVAAAMVLFVYLVMRVGFSRTASAFYVSIGIVLPLLMLLFAPATPAEPATSPNADARGGPRPSHLDAARPSPELRPTTGNSVPVSQSARLTAAAFPDLGPARTIAAGVDFYELRLGVPQGTPGQASKLYVYIPQGTHSIHTLPCVFICGAGAIPFAGMNLGAGDQPEHIPYAQAGYVVVAYEIDGEVAGGDNPTEEQIVRAINQYRASQAGLINARNAIDYALAKIPAVDPQQMFTAGHSSAGTQSLLLAEHDARLRGCIAFAPVADLEKRIREAISYYRSQVDQFDSLLQMASPRSNESQLRCPLFLFHARDDQVVPVSESMALAARLKALRRNITFVMVPQGGHYESMLQQGIPKAIDWLNELSSVGDSAPLASTDPPISNPIDSDDASNADDSMAAGGPISDAIPFDESPFAESPFGDAPRQPAASPQPLAPSMRSPRMEDESAGPVQVEQLLSGLSAGNSFARREVLQKLSRLDPESVSAGERAKVVRELEEAVLGNDVFVRGDAIKALGRWGDKGSAKILIGLLSDQGSRSLRGSVFAALGQLKDPEAAIAVAGRLGDFFDHTAAEASLRQMGSVAEDALILAAESPNSDQRLRAIGLLGDVGTEKAFDVLRESLAVKASGIGEQAKYAIRKIRVRQQAGAEDQPDQ